MQYIIMILIVIGLAAADFITGIIKGYVTKALSSAVMRKGGLSKLAEIVIMSTICGLEIGLEKLGQYYGDKPKEWADLAGAVTAVGVFLYITLMELLSMLENYCVINPNAIWAQWIVKRLKITTELKEEEENETKGN